MTDFLRNVFKQYDEKLNYCIKDSFTSRPPSGMLIEDANKLGFRENSFPHSHMNMSMNMSNNFLHVPSMNTDEIESFQRKMY